MIELKVIRGNNIIYCGKVDRVYINAENFGIIELQQGCANAMYKICGNVKFTTDKNKETILQFENAVVSANPNTIKIIDV